MEPLRNLGTYWLGRAQTHVSRKWAKLLKEYDLIPSEWAALREMYKPGRTSPTALAQVLGMSKGGASKLVNRLVRKKLARKTVSAFDRRYHAVGLRIRGEQLVRDLLILERTNEFKSFRGIYGSKRRALFEGLQRMVRPRKTRHQPTVWSVPIIPRRPTPKPQIPWPTMQKQIPAEFPTPWGPIPEIVPATNDDREQATPD
jgi:DNA-binding MarR family transcriptional regulator